MRREPRDAGATVALAGVDVDLSISIITAATDNVSVNEYIDLIQRVVRANLSV